MPYLGDIFQKLFEYFLKNYQKDLEEKMKDSNFVFESGKPYIKSSKWLRNKGATINPQNYYDNKCFQYSTSAALNHQKKWKSPRKNI